MTVSRFWTSSSPELLIRSKTWLRHSPGGWTGRWAGTVGGPGIPVNVVPATLSGSADVGSLLTITPGTWLNADSIAYAWFRDGSIIVGQPNLTYTTSAADIGKEVTAKEAATNAVGSDLTTTNGINVVGYVNVNSETDLVVAAYASEPNDTRQALMDDLIGTLKTEGIWAQLDCFYVMAAGEQQGARVNWKDPGTFDLTNEGSGTTFVNDEGFNTNGSGHLNTGYNLRNSGGQYSLDDACAGMWVGHTGTVAASVFGAYPSGGPGLTMTLRRSGNDWATRLNSSTSWLEVGLDSGDDQGLFHIQRTASNFWLIYRRGVSLETTTIDSVSQLANETVRIGGIRGGSYAAVNKWRAAYLGGALGTGDNARMNTALATYMTAVVGGL